jgi:hypothetical protein
MIAALVLVTIVACSSTCGILFYIGFIGLSSPIINSNSEKDKKI